MVYKTKDLETANMIVLYVEKNYNHNINYDDLVKRFGMNKYKLKVAFKAVSKDSIHEHVIKYRINVAKHYLECSDKTIDDIAAIVGFDRSNLHLHFKRLTGKTPSIWRKENTESLHLYTKPRQFAS